MNEIFFPRTRHTQWITFFHFFVAVVFHTVVTQKFSFATELNWTVCVFFPFCEPIPIVRVCVYLLLLWCASCYTVCVSYKNISTHTVSRHTPIYRFTFTITFTRTYTSLGWFSCVKYVSVCVLDDVWFSVRVCECILHTKYNSLSNAECKLFESQHTHSNTNVAAIFLSYFFYFFICFFFSSSLEILSNVNVFDTTLKLNLKVANFLSLQKHNGRFFSIQRKPQFACH